MMESLVNKVFNVNKRTFEAVVLEVFRFQAQINPVYREYLQNIECIIKEVKRLQHLPFLPISFFKTHKVLAQGHTPEVVFLSSGTTSLQTSKHHVASLELYEQSFCKSFEHFYGKPSNYCILALLPSYLEREGSSLVYMVQHLIEQSSNEHSGFYLNNVDELSDKLQYLEKQRQPTILIGVTFALLKLAKNFKGSLKNTIIMETGGMKGRGKELVREELHATLCKAFGVSSAHSEYGMTELLSQAYSKERGVFHCPNWMKVMVRDPYDPLSVFTNGGSGAINVIDLANIYSCSFIQTDDLGTIYSDGTFEILGRMDGSQVRGCNLMV